VADQQDQEKAMAGKGEAGNEVYQQQWPDKPTDQLMKNQLKGQPGVPQRVEKCTVPEQAYETAKGDPSSGR